MFPDYLLQILCCQQIRDIKQLLITNKNANIILGTEKEAKCVNYTNAARGAKIPDVSVFKMQIFLHVLYLCIHKLDGPVWAGAINPVGWRARHCKFGLNK